MGDLGEPSDAPLAFGLSTLVCCAGCPKRCVATQRLGLVDALRTHARVVLVRGLVFTGAANDLTQRGLDVAVECCDQDKTGPGHYGR